MNILFVDQFSEPGGAQLCLRDLMPEIIRRGWKPRMMIPPGGELVDWSFRNGIPVHALPIRPYTNGRKTAPDLLRFSLDAPRMAATIRETVIQHEISLLYVNGPRILPSAIGVSCPVIFHAHSCVGGVYARKLAMWSLRRSRAIIIAASCFVAHSYIRLPPRRVHVIYNGVPDLSLGARSFDERPRCVGILGRIAPEKGHLDFLRAAGLIAKEHPDTRFIVFGDRLFSDPEYDQRVRAEASNLPVEFRGWTRDVAAALHDLDVLAVPSGPAEAAARVVIEAFSAGTPVVAYPSGGIPELITSGHTGILTESPSPDALARSISDLLAHSGKIQGLAARGREEWQRRFRIDTFQNNICNQLENAVRQVRLTTFHRHPAPPPEAAQSRRSDRAGMMDGAANHE